MHLLKHKWPRLSRIALRNRQEIVKARLSRRDMVKLGLLTATGALVMKKGLHPRASAQFSGECEFEESPPTIPFVDPLVIPPTLPQRDPALDPGFTFSPPTTIPNRAINPATGIPFEGRNLPHQFRDRFPPQKFFIERMRPNPNTRFSDDATNLSRIGPQLTWGFNTGGADPSDVALSPGPTIVSRYGTPILIRRFNELAPPPDGFGVPEVSTHLHNFHSGPDSDGGPCDPASGGFSTNPLQQGRFFFMGQFYDYFHTMATAGFDTPQYSATNGDIRETLTTLWYHDHRVDHTAENVYKGLAGMHFVFNDFDTGDESTGFRLPSYPEFDIPLVLTDKQFTDEGELCFDTLDFDGWIGDKMIVNGKMQPYFDVLKRRYRFRILDGGPSRFYRLYLTNPDSPSQKIPMYAITTTDGNLLTRPQELKNGLPLSVAERCDVIIDFKYIWENFGHPDRIYLENRLEQDDGKGPDSFTDVMDPLEEGVRHVIMEFRLTGPDTVEDASFDPRPVSYPHVACSPNDCYFSPICLPNLPTDNAPAPEDKIRLTRHFRFERGNSQWQINDRFVDCTDWRFRFQRNTAERWIISNNSGGWKHPVHIHMEEHRIIKRNGKTVACGNPRLEFGRKDVIWLGHGDEVEILIRFRDFLGTYPVHCHNTVHEDHAMMLLFEVAEQGDNETEP